MFIGEVIALCMLVAVLWPANPDVLYEIDFMMRTH